MGTAFLALPGSRGESLLPLQGPGHPPLGREVTQTQGCSGLGKQFHTETTDFSRGETQTFQDAVEHL